MLMMYLFSPVQVLPMNDEPPQLGGGLRGELSVEEGGRVQVTVEYLSATDRDSDDSRLTYILARSPGEGQLQRGGQVVDRFSQQDLLQGLVFYVHTGEPAEPPQTLNQNRILIHPTVVSQEERSDPSPSGTPSP